MVERERETGREGDGLVKGGGERGKRRRQREGRRRKVVEREEEREEACGAISWREWRRRKERKVGRGEWRGKGKLRRNTETESVRQKARL